MSAGRWCDPAQNPGVITEIGPNAQLGYASGPFSAIFAGARAA
jgi:hypothetical protein